MENKTSSVEWLFNEIAMPEYGEPPKWVMDILQQAKEMHREEIERAVTYGMAESVRERYSDNKLSLKPKGEEQKYYNKTFKG